MNTPEPASFRDFQPGRLRSLLEMFKFDAVAFHRAVSSMQHTQTQIQAKQSKSVKEGVDGSITIDPITDPVFLGVMVERANELKGTLGDLGAPVTIKAVDDMLKGLVGGMPTYEGVSSAYTDIQITLNRELETATILALTPTDGRWYQPDRPLFGDDFANKFRTQGEFELDEAAKCLALGRPTAAVFHLMRLMEIGIRTLSKSLGIPDPVKPVQRNWAMILRTIWDGIEAKWPTAAARMSGNGALFEALHASLDAVKSPWRDPTMHVEKKYTDDEAEHIFYAVKGFMKTLAARMDENGLPLA